MLLLLVPMRALLPGTLCRTTFAAAVRCRLALRVGQPSGRAPRIDAAALLDPANGPAVEDILRQAPEIPWGVNVNGHAALLSEYLYQGLSQAFPSRHGG